jgi:hypothetical protein
MLAALFFQLNELDHVTSSCIAVAAKAAERTRLRIDLHTGGMILVEGAANPVVPIWFQAVML